MANSDLRNSADSPREVLFASTERRTVGSYERELTAHRRTEIRLREALAREEALLHHKDELIQRLLSLQSRASANAEAASQLAIAADRVATVGRIHRRLHSIDGVQTVAFKQYLEDLCRDYSTMLCSEERIIVVEGIEIELPTVTAVPLSFIANELITNAAKYGEGRITVGLKAMPESGYALSVSNDGPVLTEGFNPAGSKGLGMAIIRSFVERIGGELRIGRGDNHQSTQFTVMFSCTAL